MRDVSCLYYLDRNNNIQIDRNNSFINTCNRKISCLFGQRNYDVFDVLNRTFTDNKLNIKDIKAIRDLAGNKLGITTDRIRFLFNQLIFSKGQEDREAMQHEFSTACLENSKFSKKVQEFQKKIKNPDAERILSTLLEEANLKVKMKGVKLDPQAIEKHFEDYKFLFKTRLIYSILGYKNSTSAGRLEHDILEKTDTNGVSSLYIKKQGQWTSVKSIQEGFNWDKTEGVLATKGNANERWNYFNEGLVPIDRFFHHEAANQTNYPLENAKLHPIASLSKCEMSHLLAHAKEFDGFNTESNPTNENEPLNCVIQFVSNPRPDFAHPALQNANGQVTTVHCGIRVITNDRKVYSTGFGSTLNEDKYNTGGTKYLGSINGQPTIMDYEEFRTHDGRVVTSIAVNEKRARNILEHLNNYRAEAIRFNILMQNCMCLGVNILWLCGVMLSIRVPFNEVIWRALPHSDQLPVVGPSIRAFLNETKKIRRNIKAKTPESIKKIFQALSKIVFFIPTKISTLFKNLFIISFGGKIGSPIRSNAKLKDFEKEENHMMNFNKLVSNLFDDSASDVQHSSVFINWQLKQKSTVVHKYSGQPKMNILPPTSNADKHYSKKRKADFVNIYKRSNPVEVE